jgi:hypothetical protein
MIIGLSSQNAGSANGQIVFCNVCGEHFAVWSRTGCADHTYAMGFNFELNATHDNLPAAKVQ